MTSAIVKAKAFFPSNDIAQTDHFLLHNEELACLPSVVFIAPLELFCLSLT